MSLFKQRADYFKGLANKNKLIAHGREVDGEVRNAFFRMNDEEEVLAACVSWIHFPCLVQMGFSGRFTTAINVMPKLKPTNTLLVLQKANQTDMDSIEAAYDLSFEAMLDVISGIWKEYEVMGGCGVFADLDLSRFSFNPIGPINGDLFGWALTFEDNQSAEQLIKFDASKWYE
jgi:hypothetical protein